MQISHSAGNVVRSGPFSLASVRRHWLWALVVAVAGGLLAYLASYAITPVFLGHAVLLPVKGESGASSLLELPSALGNLASMAGIATDSDDAVEALETLQSRSLAEQFIREHDLVDTLAEPSIVRRMLGLSSNLSSRQKLNRAIVRLRDSVINVIEDKRTGVVHVSAYWQDPGLAADWANGLVDLVNRRLRNRAINESKGRLDFLNREAESTNVVGVKVAIYRVIEAEIKSMTLAKAREEFAFRVIDPAAPSELDEPVRPRRSAFLVAGFFLGGISTVLYRHRRESTV